MRGAAETIKQPFVVPCEMRARQTDKSVQTEAEAVGLPAPIAQILANRIADPKQIELVVNPRLKNLDDPSTLPDVDRAAERIIQAICSGETAGIISDHDVDGVMSAGVLWSTLIALGHPPERIQFYISRRLTEGYGLNDHLADRILSDRTIPTLCITADCGTGDESRIARLKKAGCETIVTDHHTMPVEGYPKSAYACVSPIRDDSQYRDRTICGAMTVWLLMAQVRRIAIEVGYLPEKFPSFATLLPMVAMATVADCVSLASVNNRAVISAGLRMLNESERPYALAMREALCGDGQAIDEEMVGFQIGPRIAAVGRLDEAMPSVMYIKSESIDEARSLLLALTEANEERKAIQREMTSVALDIAREQVAGGRIGLAVHMTDGMAGVHGITASRITECFGLPSVMLSPVVDRRDLTAGSGRSIESVDIKKALLYVNERAPGLLKSFGGHPAACGMRVETKDVPIFQTLFDEAIRAFHPSLRAKRVLQTDGVLRASFVSTGFFDQVRRLAPFGRGFEAPSWSLQFSPSACRLVGKDPVHLQFRIEVEGCEFKAIWFHAIQAAGMPPPFNDGDLCDGVFALSESFWKGARRIDLQCRYAQVVAT